MTEGRLSRDLEESLPNKVAFELTPQLRQELARILGITDLGTPPEVFRRAFTLLRIHVDAAQRGKQILLVDPDRPNEKFIISLPFEVSRNAS